MADENPLPASDNSKETTKRKRPWWKRLLRLFGFLILFLIILVVALIFFIRSPWGQDIIVGKATNYVSGKTQTKVEIEKLFITFDGRIDLKGLYLEDTKGDTLVYSKELQAAIPLIPIIKGEPISINRVKWEGLRANVSRLDSIQGYNFQFLIDAFVTGEEDNTEIEPTTDTDDEETLKIAVGSIDFKDFRLVYGDSVMGMDAHLNLGEFRFRGKNIDLEKMKFEAGELSLEDTDIYYRQTKPLPPTEDTTASAMPFIRLEQLNLKNVKAYYNSVPDDLTADVDLKEFLAEIPKADLAHQDIEINDLIWKDSEVKLYMPEEKESEDIAAKTSPEVTPEDIHIIWPDWEVSVRSIDFADNQLLYQVGKKPKSLTEFNPDYIDVKDFKLEATKLLLTKDGSLKASLANLNFSEASGIDMKDFSFDLALDQQELKLDNFRLESGKSQIQAGISTSYDSLDDLIKNYDQAEVVVDLKNFNFDLQDVYRFAPDLRNNEYFAKLAKKQLSGKLSAKGSLKSLDLKNLQATWGATRINTRGEFKNVMDPDALWMAVNQFHLTTYKNDVLQFVKEEDLGIAVPDTINLSSTLTGSINDLTTKTNLKIPEGQIDLEGSFANTQIMRYEGTVNVLDFDLGRILQNPEIGRVQMDLTLKGQGDKPENITADVNSTIDKFEFNEYTFSGIDLIGELVDGDGQVTLNYLDDHLDFTLDNQISLDSVYQRVSSSLEVRKAELKELNLMDKEIAADLYLSLDFENNDGVMNIESHLVEGYIDYQNKTYIMGPLNLGGVIAKDSMNLALNSKIVTAQLAANAEPGAVGKAIERQFKRYYVDSLKPLDSLHKPVQLKARMEVSPHPLLTDVFVPAITKMDTLKLTADFDQQNDLLSADLRLDNLDVLGNQIDDLFFDINSEKDVAQFVVGFENLDAGAFGMNRTFFNGDLTDGLLTVNFYSFDKNDELFYSVHSETSGKRDRLNFHLLPYNLVLNGEEWNIPEDNEIAIKKNRIEATNFDLHKETRSLLIANDLIDSHFDNNIGIGFKDFELYTLLALFNTEKDLASGLLQGNLMAVNPMDKFGLLAGFGIDDLAVMNAPLGDLSLKAYAKELDQYYFKMDLKSEDNDLEAKGYFKSADESELKLDFDLNRFGFNTIADLSQKELTDGKGYLSGKLSVSGKLSDPDYEGHIKFNGASFRVAQLNSSFALNEDKIDIFDKGLRFNKFSIEDEKGNPFTIKGSILTKRMSNPKFDLVLDAKDFNLMNSTQEDNDSFYGKLNYDLHGTIQGSLQAPDANLTIGINKNTDFTYVLDASQAAIENQEGVIEFVNRTQPSYVRENAKDTMPESKFTGLDLRAKLNIDKRANFGVIIDPRTKDNLEISGEGDLVFRMLRNGQMTLSGSYTVNEGYYQMSLYNLVRRKFDFKSGSTITWSGADPMDAELNVTAIYNIKASAAGLMSGGTSSASEEEQNQYKQRLPFLVSLNVGGRIDKPELSFGLDMDEDARGSNGGAVYSRVQQLQDDEGELNKQVFSLLVLNRFFPEAGSDGGGGGFASMARNNLTQALSDQLNNFSDQLMGESGFRLNFGLDSYETYQGGASQQRMDLDISAEQRLFNDRLIVKAGTEMNVQGELQPGEERPLLGNVSVEYLLTEDGRWRIRGFRKNEYENVIDGQVFTNGIGLMFQKDFTSFNYLFRSFFSDPQKYYQKKREEREKRKKEEEEKKQVQHKEGISSEDQQKESANKEK